MYRYKGNHSTINKFLSFFCGESKTVAYLGILVDIREDLLKDLHWFYVVQAAKVTQNRMFQLIPGWCFVRPLGEPVYHLDDAKQNKSKRKFGKYYRRVLIFYIVLNLLNNQFE